VILNTASTAQRVRLLLSHAGSLQRNKVLERSGHRKGTHYLWRSPAGKRSTDLCDAVESQSVTGICAARPDLVRNRAEPRFKWHAGLDANYAKLLAIKAKYDPGICSG
jgi:hypothetical protein